MTTRHAHPAAIGAAITFALTTAALGAPRDVQIRSVDLGAGIVELFNFASTDQPLNGFRFCTQDDDEVLRYTATTGLNGRTIEAGTSFFIHYNDDAPGGDPDRINAADLTPGLAAVAGPLDTGPYSLALYFPPVQFNNGLTMADFVQWNIDGNDDETADERTDEAFNGGLWTSETDWVATTAKTTRIDLDDATGAILHDSGDYSITNAPPVCPGDIANNDNMVDVDDLNAVLSVFATSVGVGDPRDLANNDGFVDVDDLNVILANFGASCP